jgi:hypothetical protein
MYNLNDEKKCKKKIKVCKYALPRPFMMYKSIIAMLAIYASFRHNKGFSWTHFLMAILFQEIYLVYVFAIDRNVLLS